MIKAGSPWTHDSYESDDPMKSLDRDDVKQKLWKKFQADRAIFDEGQHDSNTDLNKPRENPIAQAAMKKLQLSLLDKIIDQFMDSAH